MGREVVALEAEGADPELGGKVNDSEGVEDGSACAASERSVWKDWHGWEKFERSVDGGHWDYALS